MVATQTQFRRGTAAQVDAMTPVAGEVVIDTTNNRACIGNGSTAGGIKVPTAKDIQNQYAIYGTVGGTANAITLTNAPVSTSYAAGQRYTFKATSSNSAATTVNVDGLGVKNIYKLSRGSLVALSGSEIYSSGMYVIIYDGTQFQLFTGGGGGVLTVKQQVFTASGTYTPNAGMLYCDVELVGGGGGGGSQPSGGSDWGSGGGAAGGYACEVITAATIGASQVVTIGAAGAEGNPGGTGGTTSLGALLQATGGTGGVRGAASTSGAGGTGGVGSLGNMNADGGDGHPGGSGTNGSGGSGGASFYGGGGRGASVASVGAVGKAYGSGGGGGRTSNAGAAGKAGSIIVTEYCSQ